MSTFFLVEKVLVLDATTIAAKKQELQAKNREAARKMLEDIQRMQVSYVTSRKTTSEE